MNNQSKVEHRVRGIATNDGAGVKLTRIIGQPLLQNLDPFLMLDEFGSDTPDDYLAGFPQHPHRGFQTVTYMLAGKMRHRDSNGKEGVIESGGIQWMNAGKGIIHEEMPEQKDGLLRGFQLWVNLPKSHKYSAPDYQDIPPKEVPEFALGEDVSGRLLSGKYGNITGPVKSIDSDLPTPFFADYSSTKDALVEIELIENYQYFIYVYEGALAIDEVQQSKGVLGTLSQGNTVSIKAQANSKWILVGGKPIGKSIVQYGPFVMNSQQEIEQAISDYQAGRLTD